MTDAVRVAADRLIEELTGGDASALAAVAEARKLAATAERALQAAVDRAREAGHSWADIGMILGTSRQAAFQRFGRSVEAPTPASLTSDRAHDARQRAVELLSAVRDGDWTVVRTAFAPILRDGVDPDRIAAAWAYTKRQVGALERVGEPASYPAGDHIIVDVPLHLEAGDRIGRVAFDREGGVVGLHLLPSVPWVY